MKHTVKIAHLADCHLRNFHYGSKTRGNKFLVGLEQAIKAAKENGADLVICSGDLLDSNSPGPAVVNWQLTELNALLEEVGLSMIVSAGNHDGCTPSWLTPYETEDTSDLTLPGLHLLRDTEAILEYDTWPLRLHIASCDYCEKQEFLDWASLASGKFDIVMWHGEIQEFCGFPKPDAITVAEIPANLCQVLAMGHIHVHKSTQRETDGMVIAYPGSTEMCSEDEDEHKKFYMYTFESGDSGEARVTTLDSVSFATQPVIRRTIKTEEELEEAIEHIKNNQDVLAYIRYDKALHEAVSRLHSATGEDTVLRLTPMMPDRFNVHTMSREAVVRGPAAFFEENSADLIHDAEVRGRVAALCKSLLTPEEDRKQALNTYCDARLGTTSL